MRVTLTENVDNQENSCPVETIAEADCVTAALEAAASHLIAEQIADFDKIGLVGFSRTGYHVAYALTHSRFAYAAAIAADNIDYSYLQYVLGDNFRMTMERINGGAPYGDGLKLWAKRAPGFNAEKIRTPLRLEVDSGGPAYMLTQWELFSHLRRLERPTELAIIPNVENGEHPVQMPLQKLTSQQGTVDWMDFWLNEREDSAHEKVPQYLRWRTLRAQQMSGKKRPRLSRTGDERSR